MTVAVYHHASSHAHAMPDGHAERIARIDAVETALRALPGLAGSLARTPPAPSFWRAVTRPISMR